MPVQTPLPTPPEPKSPNSKEPPAPIEKPQHESDLAPTEPEPDPASPGNKE